MASDSESGSRLVNQKSRVRRSLRNVKGSILDESTHEQDNWLPSNSKMALASQIQCERPVEQARELCQPKNLENLTTKSYRNSDAGPKFPPVTDYLHLVNTTKGRPKQKRHKATEVKHDFAPFIEKESSALLKKLLDQQKMILDGFSNDDDDGLTDCKKVYHATEPVRDEKLLDHFYKNCVENSSDVNDNTQLYDLGLTSANRSRQYKPIVCKLAQYSALEKAIASNERALESLRKEIEEKQAELHVLEVQDHPPS